MTTQGYVDPTTPESILARILAEGQEVSLHEKFLDVRALIKLDADELELVSEMIDEIRAEADYLSRGPEEE
jgi:hypothetical protein